MRQDDGTVGTTALRHRAWSTWLGPALLAVGVVLVALPDDDRRIFSLSPEHGPAAVDLLGAVLHCVGWLLLIRSLAGPRPRVGAALRSGSGPVIAAVAGLGVGLVLASVLAQFELWWLVGAVAAAAAQLALAWRSRTAG